MKTVIEIHRLDDAFHLEAVNDNGNTIQTDGSLEIGGGNKGFSPMQLLLAALGGCSAIDILLILKKQRQNVRDLKIKVEGEREATGDVKIYRQIHLIFEVYGNVTQEKAEKAVALSIDKYCSVAKTLEPTATISWEVAVFE